MTKAPLIDELIKIQQQQLVSFHMPGHKNGHLFRKIPYQAYIEKLALLDTTEIPGTDNLHHPKGPIQKAQQRASQVFGSEESFFLVNGATSGVYSMIMAVTSPGDKILINRNCHQSVAHGLILGDCIPRYIMPDFDEAAGIEIGLSPEKIEVALQEDPDIKAVFITYPTYYGVACDLKNISEIVHKYDKILLVDEAHGAHFGLHEALPPTALSCGADLVVQSIHKTLPSFTQSAVLHRQGNRVDREKLKQMLRIHQSSSPSYLLMSSLDYAVMVYQEQGPGLMEALLGHVSWFEERLNSLEGVKLFRNQEGAQRGIYALDPTRLWIQLDQYPGHEADRLLRQEHQIQMELSNLYGILGISTLGNELSDFQRLAQALEALSRCPRFKREAVQVPSLKFHEPQLVVAPREAFYRKKETQQLVACEGFISGTTVVPYPPGIPILVPGERVTGELIRQVQEMIVARYEIIGIEIKAGEPYLEILHS